MAYSFHKLTNFSFSKLWAESLQSCSQFLICDCTAFVGVHVCKHWLQTLDLFRRKIFSNYLKDFSKSIQFFRIDENTTQICLCLSMCNYRHVEGTRRAYGNSLWHVMKIATVLTLRASFFSLFIALNCFILESTALSIGLSEALPPSLSHGWSNKPYNT